MTDRPILAATLTGPVDLLDPAPGAITVAALVHGLSILNRWAGGFQVPISVAQHSLLVREIFRTVFPGLRPFALYALLHDGHEYLIGDHLGPLEALLAAADPAHPAVVAGIKLRLDRAIRRALVLPEPPAAELGAAIRTADLLAADLEWKLWAPPANGPSPWSDLAIAHPHPFRVIRPVTPETAADRFRERLEADLAERAWERPERPDPGAARSRGTEEAKSA